MKLVDRVTHLDPKGGRFGIGLIRAEADIDPDDWFLTCHFVDDQVMPGTLMYECCLHTLRIFLLRLGWVGEADDVVCEPVPGVASRLKCRGQVTAATRTVTYEVIVKERGYRPEPYALADALMYADGKPIVEITEHVAALTGLTRELIAAELGELRSASRRRSLQRSAPPLFDTHHILAFAIGKPSEAFGEPYRVFDEDRFIARLPGRRIISRPHHAHRGRAVEDGRGRRHRGGIRCAARRLVLRRRAAADHAVRRAAGSRLATVRLAGGLCRLGADQSRRSRVPQPRRRGGIARTRSAADTGTLTTRVRLLRVASSGGMIIQDYDFDVRAAAAQRLSWADDVRLLHEGALAQQVGIREAKPYEPTGRERRGRSFDLSARSARSPTIGLRMIDRIERFVPDGGPHGLGFIAGSKQVRPDEWFFKAHFYQDPVWPGSLGLEAFLQLLKVAAVERWPHGSGVTLS